MSLNDCSLQKPLARNICTIATPLDTVCEAVLRLLMKTRFVHFAVVQKCIQQSNAQISTRLAVSKLHGKLCPLCGISDKKVGFLTLQCFVDAFVADLDGEEPVWPRLNFIKMLLSSVLSAF